MQESSGSVEPGDLRLGQVVIENSVVKLGVNNGTMIVAMVEAVFESRYGRKLTNKVIAGFRDR